MNHEFLSLAQAAAHIHLEENELRHFAQRGEIAAQRRGDEWFFEHRILDEWAQRELLSAKDGDLNARHRGMMAEQRREHRPTTGVSSLFIPETINLDLASKTRAGVLRDMTDLATAGGKVYDPEFLFKELVAREDAASTAIGHGLALLHPRFHDPYLFEESFIAYGRTRRPVFFGAADGEGTRHFFLICSTDHDAHLHILARLAVLAHGSDLVARLETAETAEDVCTVLADCERVYL